MLEQIYYTYKQDDFLNTWPSYFQPMDMQSKHMNVDC